MFYLKCNIDSAISYTAACFEEVLLQNCFKTKPKAQTTSKALHHLQWFPCCNIRLKFYLKFHTRLPSSDVTADLHTATAWLSWKGFCSFHQNLSEVIE